MCFRKIIKLGRSSFLLAAIVSLCEHYCNDNFPLIIEMIKIKSPAEITISICQIYCTEMEEKMIRYDRLWETMKEKNITQYDLYTHHNVNRSQINRLKHNQNVEVNTIDRLCNILHCQVEDIMVHFDDDNLF